MLEAVRDVVTVNPADNPRTKMSRSQTGGGQSSSSSTPRASGRRSQSQDSVTQTAAALEKARTQKANGKSSKKKTGHHVDVIDRLDFSGVGAATFHHDGPFDACAPSRNRHKSKAPMLAWTPGNEDGLIDPSAPPVPDKRLSPRAQATITAMSLSQAKPGDSPYAAVSKNRTSPRDYYFSSAPPLAPEKQVDSLAEAWGRAEPEPYEEFFTGTAVRPNGETGLASAASSIHGAKERKTREERAPMPRRPSNRPPLPPPQPISLPGTSYDQPAADDLAVPSSPGGGPKRSKSIMHRIRKMRETPNVPVPPPEIPEVAGATGDYSPPSSGENQVPPAQRPSHKHQHSLLGLLGGRKAGPTSPPLPSGSPPVSPTRDYADTKEKALPGIPGVTPSGASPSDEGGAGYFDREQGIGRKPSLMKKVKGVVKGGAR